MNTSKVAIVTSTVFGKVASITGYFFAAALLLFIVTALLTNSQAIEGLWLLIPPLALSVFLIIKGYKIKQRLKRFKRYVSLISTQHMTSLENIADSTAQSVDFVRNDLQKMIDKKYFTNASINWATNEIIIDNRVVSEPTSTPTPTPTPQQIQSKLEKLEIIAEQGNADAQFELAKCFANGNDVAKDLSKAAHWYQKAAEQGNADAQFELGDCFAYGKGVAKDPSKVVHWYQKAAEQGNAGAQYYLAKCFVDGDGVAKDLSKTVHWYQKAAEQGYRFAQYDLAECFANGKGVAKDPSKAAHWYQKAAEQGYWHAQYDLAECFANGNGVAKDLAKAEFWYTKAAAQGHDEAVEWLEKNVHSKSSAPSDEKDKLTTGVYDKPIFDYGDYGDEDDNVFAIRIYGKSGGFHTRSHLYSKIASFTSYSASQARDVMETAFQGTLKTLDDFIKYADNIFMREVSKCLDSMMEGLNHYGIYSVSRKELSDMAYGYMENWDKIYGEVLDLYNNITGEKQLANEYLEVKKASRFKFIGGGFGLKGAAKGIVTAGALNMATGAMHSIGNAISSSRISREAAKRKQEIFSNMAIRKGIFESVYLDVANLHFLYMDLIDKHDGISDNPFTFDKRIKAENIYNNILNKRVRYNHLKDTVIELIKLWPFENKYYSLAIRCFPFEYKGLEMCGDSFFSHYEGQFIEILYGGFKLGLQASFIELSIYAEFPDDDYRTDRLIRSFTFDLQKNMVLIYDFFKNHGLYSGVLNGISIAPNIDTNKLTNACQSYANIGDDEQPLLLYDGSFFGNAKVGLLITSKGIYGKNGYQIYCDEFKFGERFALDLEKKFETDNLVFNNEFNLHINTNRAPGPIFYDLYTLVIYMIPLVNSIYSNKLNLVDVLLEYRNLPLYNSRAKDGSYSTEKYEDYADLVNPLSE